VSKKKVSKKKVFSEEISPASEQKDKAIIHFRYKSSPRIFSVDNIFFLVDFFPLFFGIDIRKNLAHAFIIHIGNHIYQTHIYTSRYQHIKVRTGLHYNGNPSEARREG
jgi:hypothetical protein